MNRLKKAFFSLPAIPIFFAASYVLTLFFNNIEELAFNRLISPLLTVIAFGVISYCFFLFLFKNKLKSNLFSSIFLILFFSYGEAFIFLQKIPLPLEKFRMSQDHIVFPLWILLLILAFIWVKKGPGKIVSINKFLGVVSFIVVIFPLLSIVHYEIFQRGHNQIRSPLSLPVAQKKDNFPDIYFILPEDYSSPSIFPETFKYTDTSFEDYLKKKGFYIATSSTSNYPKSFLSVTAAMNMEYLDYLSINKNSSDQTIVNPILEDNNVIQFLKKLKYNYYQVGSWWWPTHYNKNATENFNIQKQNHLNFNDFTYSLISSTMLNPVIEKLLPMEIIGESNEDKRLITLYQFNILPEVAKKKGPKFVFVHIIAPHGPYVFDKNCEFLSQEEADLRTTEVNYINQVACINIKLKEAIETILKSSPKPPVILLETDEGADFLSGKLDPEDSWKNADTKFLQTKFPILSAYYLPGVSTSSLYPDITQVNSFRVIFNLYFGTNFPLLPDKNYIFPDTDHLYEFTDVTDKIKNK